MPFSSVPLSLLPSPLDPILLTLSEISFKMQSKAVAFSQFNSNQPDKVNTLTAEKAISLQLSSLPGGQLRVAVQLVHCRQTVGRNLPFLLILSTLNNFWKHHTDCILVYFPIGESTVCYIFVL